MTRLRWVVGLAWIVTWLGILYLVAAPWQDLGGLVSERLRWLEGFVLFAGLVLGFSLGGVGRELVRPETGRTYGRLMRYLLYPPALLAAAGLALLAALDQHDAIGVALTGFLSYWAGLDLSFGALPLLDGNPPGHPFDSGTEAAEDSWVPPWDLK